MKILKGIISEEILKQEPSFTWMKTDLRDYQPPTSLVNTFKNKRDSIHLILFGGTWCEDTHVILPRFFKLIHQAEIPAQKITLLGVDRKKQTLGYLSQSLQVNRVPTIIIMRNGKESGRIVEYGKNGNVDQELLEILQKPL
jgi:hypothetical protein